MLVVLAFAVFAVPRLVTALYAWKKVISVESAPSRRVAIVFGAGLLRDGSPTAVLRDRVAVRLDVPARQRREEALRVPAPLLPQDGDPHAKNDRRRTSGFTPPARNVRPLVRLVMVTSAGLNSSGSIL